MVKSMYIRLKECAEINVKAIFRYFSAQVRDMISNSTIDLLKQHMSIRAFTDEPVSDEMIETIFTAAYAGPNFSNLQPVTFIEITDQQFKADISAQVGMSYIETATRFFVVTVDFNKDLIGLDDETRRQAEARLSNYSMLEGGVVSAGVALARAQVAAESLGLGCVTMAGAVGSFELYEERLHLPKFVKAVMGFSVGYPAQNPGIKPKLSLPGILMTDKYDQKQMEEAVKTYDDVMVKYYDKRGADNSWIRNNAKVLTRQEDLKPLSNYPVRKGFNLR